MTWGQISVSERKTCVSTHLGWRINTGCRSQTQEQVRTKPDSVENEARSGSGEQYTLVAIEKECQRLQPKFRLDSAFVEMDFF
jgi:hypothetical protein